MLASSVDSSRLPARMEGGRPKCPSMTASCRRAVPPLTDGWRHVYHLRDTHFNVRGNRVAGEALAQALAELPR